jgi:hypothetical protein
MHPPCTCPASSGVSTNNRYLRRVSIRFYCHFNPPAIFDEPFSHCYVHRAYFTPQLVVYWIHNLLNPLSLCEPTHIDSGCFQVSVYIYLFHYNRYPDCFYYLIVFISLFCHTANGGTTTGGAFFGGSLLKRHPRQLLRLSPSSFSIHVGGRYAYWKLESGQSPTRKRSARWKKAIKGNQAASDVSGGDADGRSNSQERDL